MKSNSQLVSLLLGWDGQQVTPLRYVTDLLSRPERSPVERPAVLLRFTQTLSKHGHASLRSATNAPRRPIFLLLILLFTLPPRARGQLSFDTNSVAPQRFIAAHGRRAVAMGYASSGLELWAYPLLLIDDYHPGFRVAGETSEIKGDEVLRRITYDPESITRTYIGPDFIVHEKLFVPLNEQAIFLTYTVECTHSIDVIIHFQPVLNLMWPASLGGQNTHWDSSASAYVLAEATQKYQALIGSPAVITHNKIFNSAQPGTPGRQLAFAVSAGGEGHRSATVIVARNQVGSSPEARLRELLAQENKFEDEARVHYQNLLANTLRIETPDPAINQQLVWAQIALDQAWVCNDVIGCGLIAGYGPSRNARRPQYDWFFAGDGLVAVNALVNSGDYDRAKEELSFIAKYQDARTGMIWHEISQSVDPGDWATKYPYMFVHVDITFQYLKAVEHYVSASGDLQFAQQSWRRLEAAYRYCVSLLDPGDGVPRIPSTKEGGDEQDRMMDDLNLSTSWVAAAAAFARLAKATEHTQLAEDATQLSARAKQSVLHRYWDDPRSSWIDGFDGSGHAVLRHGDNGVNLVPILDLRRAGLILDQVASSDFETDWGTRGVASSSSHFDPNSYASGSVSALGTSGVASAFWAGHRPSTAFSIWNSLFPWGTLDSMGHMHEVLTGDYFHQQIESVPEQTWSSAGLISSTVEGLLALEREAGSNLLSFSPHLPATWDKISVSNVKVAKGTVAMTVLRVPAGLELRLENSGTPVDLSFSPEIPLGTHLRGATLDGKPLAVHEEDNQQDAHAAVTFKVPTGKSDCLLRYEGGVSVTVTDPVPLVGESSKGIKVISIAHKPGNLVLSADVSPNMPSSIIVLRTSEHPVRVHGAKLITVSEDEYKLAADQSPIGSTAYHRIEITVDFAENKR
jgi:glycogen debranching enzyme